MGIRMVLKSEIDHGMLGGNPIERISISDVLTALESEQGRPRNMEYFLAE